MHLLVSTSLINHGHLLQQSERTMALKLSHQKGALSYEKYYRHNSNDGSLSNRMPPDEHAKLSLFTNKEIELKALNNAHEKGEVACFDLDSTNLYIYSCVADRLTGFRIDFIEGTRVDIEEQTSDATTGKASIVGEGIAVCTMKDDDGENHTLHTRMAYALSSKYRCMAPKWLGIKDKEKGTPKYKRSRCELDDEEVMLYLDER